MQVETLYTFKNYLYIVISGFFSQNKVEKICVISWGLLDMRWLIANSALRASLATRARGIIVNYYNGKCIMESEGILIGPFNWLLNLS